MEKRFTFECWNCERTYTLFRRLDGKPVLNVGCPYCQEEATVALAPYLKKSDSVLRGAATEIDVHALDLPDILPTAKKSKE